MSHFNRRQVVIAGSAAALVPGALHAQAWPAKPIRWVVPYTAGGLTDITTRLTLDKMNVGQPFVVENKPGANSQIGAEMVANAAPDGYTFLTVIAAHAANKTLYAGRQKYDPVKSFAPVSLVGLAPLIITVNNDLPAKNVGELIAYAKKNPGKVAFGSSGIGAAAHLTSELMKQVAGIDMVHIPYKGTAPALVDLIAGNIQMLIDVPLGVMAQVKAGKIRALAMTSKERVPGVDVPTIVESGGPLIESSTWVMFLAPAGTPAEIVNKMQSEVNKAMNDEALKKRLGDQGVIAVGSSPADTAKFLQVEIDKWAKVITAANVKPDS